MSSYKPTGATGKKALWTRTYPEQVTPTRPKTPKRRGLVRRQNAPKRRLRLDTRRPDAKNGPRQPLKRQIRSRTPANERRNRLYLAKSRAWLARPENRLCEACMLVPELIKQCGGEPWPATQCHHLRGRQKTKRVDLLLYEPLFCAVSAVGHVWIDSHRDRARALGLLAERGDWGRTDDLPEDAR